MKKILIIVNDLRNGGVERVLSILANYLSEHNYKIYIRAVISDNQAYKINPNIDYKYVNVIRKGVRENLIREIKNIIKFMKIIKDVDPDWLISFDDSLIVRTAPGAKLLRKKMLVSERLDPAAYKNILLKFARKWAFKVADKVVFQTQDARDYFSKKIRDKSTIIPNPLSDNLPQRAETINKDIVMACRLYPQKNIFMAIDAFALLYLKHPEYRLVIYGDGVLREELIKYSEAKNVAMNVVFPGHSTEIHKIMQECAMYISSSDYEGISNSMLEALAIGVPSVVTDCPVGGARMFIENGVNGFLVPVGDSVAMYKAMKGLIENPDLAKQFSDKSVLIRNQLGIDVICPKWEALINDRKI